MRFFIQFFFIFLQTNSYLFLVNFQFFLSQTSQRVNFTQIYGGISQKFIEINFKTDYTNFIDWDAAVYYNSSATILTSMSLISLLTTLCATLRGLI